LRLPHPVRVAINGADAAGKTTLADELSARIGERAIRASVDDFARPRVERYARGRFSPEGFYRDSTDLAALVERLLAPLGPGGSRGYVSRVFDVARDRVVEDDERTAPDDAVLLLDGIFLLRPELRPHLDWSVFLRVAPATCIERALHRDPGDPDETRAVYERRYMPGQALYFEEARPERYADLVIDNERIDAPFILD
jgi:uridine kinase